MIFFTPFSAAKTRNQKCCVRYVALGRFSAGPPLSGLRTKLQGGRKYLCICNYVCIYIYICVCVYMCIYTYNMCRTHICTNDHKCLGPDGTSDSSSPFGVATGAAPAPEPGRDGEAHGRRAHRGGEQQPAAEHLLAEPMSSLEPKRGEFGRLGVGCFGTCWSVLCGDGVGCMEFFQCRAHVSSW